MRWISTYWLYEVYTKEIEQVLGHTTRTHEVYLISMKYEWLFCVNHHNYVIAAGSAMAEK